MSETLSKENPPNPIQNSQTKKWQYFPALSCNELTNQKQVKMEALKASISLTGLENYPRCGWLSLLIY